MELAISRLPEDAHAAAYLYLDQGLHPVPVPHQSKACILEGWPTLVVDRDNLDAYFPRGVLTNIALRLDGDLVDIDLDSSEAVAAAPFFFPATDRVSGRAGKRRSHLWYRSLLGHETFAAPAEGQKGAMLLEIRNGAHLTLVPPSVHPSGEQIVWERFGDPAEVEPEILRAAAVKTAIVAYLAVAAPGEGARHEYWLAAGGCLLRWGLSIEEVVSILEAAATVAGDDEVDKRIAAVKDTAGKLAAGSHVTGGPRLVEIADDPHLPNQIRKWLGIREVRDTEIVPETMTARLVQIGRRAELIHDEDRTPYGVIPGSSRNVVKISSTEFKHWLTNEFFRETGNVATRQPIADAVHMLSAIAAMQGDEVKPHVRIASTEGALFIDLATSDGAVVKVTAGQWEIGHDAPVYFRRPRGMRPLPAPAHGGDLTELDGFLNLADIGQRQLIYTWLTYCLREDGPFPVTIFAGEHGAAKSSAARVCRLLTDPNKASLRPRIREERDLVISAANAWMLSFDNLSGLSPAMSDAICRLATGGGFGTRQLYTDDEEMLFDVKRPVILNGIDDLAERGDLMDRAIVFTLPTIPKQNRRNEEEFWTAFGEAHSAIFGALLDATAAALEVWPNVHLEDAPRMADFARWGVALERGMKWPSGSFLAAYEANRRHALETALEADVVALAIVTMMQTETHWRGTAESLLAHLTAKAHLYKIDVHERYWPKAPNHLSRRIRRMAPVLREYGIETHREREGVASRRIIVIRRVDGADSSDQVAEGHGVDGSGDGVRALADPPTPTVQASTAVVHARRRRKRLTYEDVAQALGRRARTVDEVATKLRRSPYQVRSILAKLVTKGTVVERERTLRSGEPPVTEYHVAAIGPVPLHPMLPSNPKIPPEIDLEEDEAGCQRGE